MEKFIGTKVIEAEPMDRRAYCTMRGWDLPADEDGDDTGFLVKYSDGYISWSPTKQFVDAYNQFSAMTFGHAVEMLKQGSAVARAGWNGKGMFLYLVPAPEKGYPAQTGVAKEYFGDGALVPYAAYIAMKTATGEVVPWLASQTDVLADDWSVVSVTPQA